MADVAFLLIIFFLVASFYSVTRGIQFSLPKHDEAALTAEPEAAVLIEIAADGGADGRQPRAWRSRSCRAICGPSCSETRRSRSSCRPSLDAPYQAMTDVFDELRQVGVQNLVIPTSTELQMYGLRQLQ